MTSSKFVQSSLEMVINLMLGLEKGKPVSQTAILSQRHR